MRTQTVPIAIRLTENQRELLRAAAKEAQITFTALVRDSAMSRAMEILDGAGATKASES